VTGDRQPPVHRAAEGEQDRPPGRARCAAAVRARRSRAADRRPPGTARRAPRPGNQPTPHSVETGCPALFCVYPTAGDHATARRVCGCLTAGKSRRQALGGVRCPFQRTRAKAVTACGGTVKREVRCGSSKAGAAPATVSRSSDHRATAPGRVREGDHAGASSSRSRAGDRLSVTDGRRGGRCWSGGTPRLPRACQLLKPRPLGHGCVQFQELAHDNRSHRARALAAPRCWCTSLFPPGPHWPGSRSDADALQSIVNHRDPHSHP